MNKQIRNGFGIMLAIMFVASSFIASCGNSGDGTPATTYGLGLGAKPLPSGFGMLYSFGSSTANGANPNEGVIIDNKGNLYGTTAWGGSNNLGTVFKLTASGTLSVLHSFTGWPADGEQPDADLGQPIWGQAEPEPGLTMDEDGNLYGNTQFGGGFGGGTVFKLNSSGTETVLHSFYGWDGIYPSGQLVRDESGNLYGTTTYGGPLNRGTVFKIDMTGNLTVLYSFKGSGLDGTGKDPAYPLAGLIIDNSGNLYGTTVNGGANGSGTVFKLDGSGTLTVLHSFGTGSTDGAFPESELIRDNKGSLYGTTVFGGANNLGTVFKLDTGGMLTLLHSFNGTDGEYPYSALIMDNKGNLYGTTDSGGSGGKGTVFKLDASGNHSVLRNFSGADGSEPMGLTMDNKGIIYGTTFGGGPYNAGTIFRLVQ